MVHLNLICDHNVAFKRAQVCPNWFSYLREKDVSLRKIGLKVTFPVRSPEPEIATMTYSHLIRGHISAFKRAQDRSNQLSCLQETDVSS